MIADGADSVFKGRIRGVFPALHGGHAAQEVGLAGGPRGEDGEEKPQPCQAPPNSFPLT